MSSSSLKLFILRSTVLILRMHIARVKTVVKQNSCLVPLMPAKVKLNMNIKIICRNQPTTSSSTSGTLKFLAATKQLYEWFSPSVWPSGRPSVRLSVCLSVCHTFLTMFPSSYHHEIFMSYYQWQKWRPCKRSMSEVKGQGHGGHNPA